MIKLTLFCTDHRRFNPELPDGTQKDPAKIRCKQCQSLSDLIEVVRLYQKKQKDNTF